MATIGIKAGERKRIIRKFSSSVATAYQFSADPVDNSGDVAGIIEVKGSRWLFSKPVETQDLQRQNSVHKGMWDTFYSVYVVPDVDVNITFPRSHIAPRWMYITIAVFILILAAGLLIITTG